MNEQNARTGLSSRGEWAPFMCPACRGLFRAPTDREGKVECPLCDTPSLLPHREVKEEPRVIEPLERTPRARPKEEDWDSRKQNTEENNSGSGGLLLASFFIFSILVAVGIFFILQNRGASKAPSPSGEKVFKAEKFQGKPSDGITASAQSGSSNKLLQVNSADLENAREAARNFLSCEKIEDFAPLIRDADRVMPLVTAYYAQKPFEPEKFRRINDDGTAQVAKRFTSFDVILENYITKPIAVEITDKGPLVDWESWVGYCEIPWETFVDERIKKPTVVRLTASRAFYFNFEFRDDSKWLCYQLERSADDPVLFGYLPIDSPLKEQLPRIGAGRQTFVAKIRYPDNVVAKNQVLITDLIQSGWVLGL
ncbi:hypothetical protein [Roseibacillus persicicus]|uniref:Uncharacterized protein n=1 Tax=Roseibacillus persicicus TaxID=454148 RepID=A0A918TWW0_9BACT|nr:hypothetical protein [Roseibacillus persicicus]GHC65494.1 hypothetical protein GCM10007100_36590 [Roseibacillus persicicus]